jgi:putative membrane protein
MNTNQFTRVILLCTLSIGVSAWADSAKDQAKAQKVLSDLHQTNQTEIKIGRMAKEKASSNQIRAYAEELVQDHQNADRQVQALARKDGIELVPPKTSGWLDRIAVAKDDHIMTTLSKKTGPEFDKAFTNAMIDDHKRDIANLESIENSLKPSDVRDLIANLLPTLQQHLDQAEQIQRSS